MAKFRAKSNPLTGNSDWEMQEEYYDLHQEIARSAFADMLHDKERNNKYYRALQLAIDKMHNDGKKANVLDIGTGTGLFSIMAARLGADSIVACEFFKPMADCCIKILERNGVADKIIVIPKRSTDLTVGENGDMKQKANILITELFDSELIGEGALSTFSHAHKKLIEKDCIVIPDSAVIYAQVVESPTLQKWNKLNDLADGDLEIILRTPQKMKDCAGSAAIHDIQLSQLPRHEFRDLSGPIPVLYYDWTGQMPIDMKRMVKQKFTAIGTGNAQIVFMWWELKMDPEGEICLSCAPWWAHPDADMSSERPQDTIPWRDHWLQGVYYLPQELPVQKDTELTLISCQDEYSLWFYLEDKYTRAKHYERHICECGVHMAMSRTNISYANDVTRSNILLAHLRKELTKDSVVLNIEGYSFLGLAAAKMGAKMVYILLDDSLTVGVLNDYIEYNNINNVKILSDIDFDLLDTITNVVYDPSSSTTILPNENLKMAFVLYNCRGFFKKNVSYIPETYEFWAMPVESQDMQKIRVPLNNCDGIDMSVFDDFIENSRFISDREIEGQPMWEYPCICRGVPRKLLDVDMRNLKRMYETDNTYPLVYSENTEEVAQKINGFALWGVWKVGGKKISSGHVQWPVVGERVVWDPHTFQAVKILKESHTTLSSTKWTCQVACDLFEESVNVNVEIVIDETMQ